MDFYLCFLATTASVVLCNADVETFTAAVYEHDVIFPSITLTPTSRQEAVKAMRKNLDIYEKAAREATVQVQHLISSALSAMFTGVYTSLTLYSL